MDKPRRHYCSNTDTYEGAPSEMIIRRELLVEEFKTVKPLKTLHVFDSLLTLNSQIHKLYSSYRHLTSNK